METCEQLTMCFLPEGVYTRNRLHEYCTHWDKQYDLNGAPIYSPHSKLCARRLYTILFQHSGDNEVLIIRPCEAHMQDFLDQGWNWCE